MQSLFKVWRTNRGLLLNFFEKYSLEQLNKTPEGFTNNLIWNIGHIVVAQQALVYLGSNLEGYISRELLKQYMPGTKPTGVTTQEEVDELKGLLMSVIDKTEADYAEGKFTSYNEREIEYGFKLSTPEDAFQFNNYHEAVHLGFMMNIRKFV